MIDLQRFLTYSYTTDNYIALPLCVCMIFKYVYNTFHFRWYLLINRAWTHAKERDILLHFAVLGQHFFPSHNSQKMAFNVDGTRSCWYSSKYILC